MWFNTIINLHSECTPSSKLRELGKLPNTIADTFYKVQPHIYQGQSSQCANKTYEPELLLFFLVLHFIHFQVLICLLVCLVNLLPYRCTYLSNYICPSFKPRVTLWPLLTLPLPQSTQQHYLAYLIMVHPLPHPSIIISRVLLQYPGYQRTKSNHYSLSNCKSCYQITFLFPNTSPNPLTSSFSSLLI